MRLNNGGASGGRTLVVAPLSILQCSWGNDIEKFTPEPTYAIADAKNRESAFNSGADIVLINHDGVKFLKDRSELLEDFNTLVVDESTAFKHYNSQRSKAIKAVAQNMDYRVILTGTPNSNGVLDLWHQIFLVDDGEHLGQNYFGFRNLVCKPRVLNVAGRTITKWVEKDSANAKVTSQLNSITFRVKFEDVIEIPLTTNEPFTWNYQSS